MTDGPDRYVLHATCASVPRWATRSSSDAAGVIRTPDGGLAVIMIDVQGSGPGGSTLARSLFAQASNLLHAGLTADLVVAGLHLNLHQQRGGKVLASILLAVQSSDARAVQIVTAGDHAIAFGASEAISTELLASRAAGSSRGVDAVSRVIAFAPDTVLVLPNDGVAATQAELRDLLPTGANGADWSAAGFLNRAIERDHLRPRSDMAVACLSLARPSLVDGIETSALSISSLRPLERET